MLQDNTSVDAVVLQTVGAIFLSLSLSLSPPLFFSLSLPLCPYLLSLSNIIMNLTKIKNFLFWKGGT